jgi:hypothetical protein
MAAARVTLLGNGIASGRLIPRSMGQKRNRVWMLGEDLVRSSILRLELTPRLVTGPGWMSELQLPPRSTIWGLELTPRLELTLRSTTGQKGIRRGMSGRELVPRT